MSTYATPEDHPLWNQQVSLERLMTTQGVDRFRYNLQRNREQGRGSTVGGASTAISAVIEPLSMAIKDFIKEAKGRTAGRHHSLVSYIDHVEPEVMAYLAARALFNQTNKKRHIKVTRIAAQIGRSVELEERINRFEKENPALCRTVVDDLNTRTSHEGHRAKVIRHVMAQHSATLNKGWDEKTYIRVGLKLLELMEASTRIIEIAHIWIGVKRLWIVELNQSFWTWIEQMDDINELKLPTYLPCIIPPKPWTSLRSGGYHTNSFVFPPSLVRRMTPAHEATLGTADLSEVYDAINDIQGTSWKIEPRTLAVVEEVIRTGLNLSILPPMEKEMLPTKPADIDTNEAALALWKRQARGVHDQNETSGARRIAALRQVAIAKEFVSYKEIFFPHNLDFRGRCYPIATGLTPQDGDLGRSLLVFAEGAAIIDDRAEGWLAIHGANRFGQDKVSLDDRVQWTYDHSQEICEAAADPLANLWWTEADEPWCFLTWCFEWADFVEEGRGFVSHIPIALDGTCNGIQHYSAMLRDPIGAEAVNLLPSNTPQDIYEEVAKVVRGKLENICGDFAVASPSHEQIVANKWRHFGITRKITKRPVMVLPYGGTQKSCRNYVLEAVREEIEAGKTNPFGEELIKASNFLSAIIWESIAEVVVAARIAMGWLKDTARVLVAGNKIIEWTAPTGFVIQQAYVKTTKRRVNTQIHGHTVKLVLAEGADELDPRRQINGISPNFVHSLDAAALMKTVSYAAATGVRSFAMIHDSYGCLAAHTDVLATCTREAFVDMYQEHNPLEEFRTSAFERLPEADLPSVPEAGGLDLSEVLHSQFFFA